MLKLAGKAALVTGGSRGIGAAVARRLAEDGADVAVTYANAEDKARSVIADVEASGRRGHAIRADSRDPAAVMDAVDRAAAEFGRFDILVNNAGVFPFGSHENFTIEDIDSTLAIHVRAVFVASQSALRHMDEGGRIISIGSCIAWRVPQAGLSLYAMSKSALIGFTKGLARDVGSRGITVNMVDPGSIDTDMNPASNPDADAERKLTALGRYGAPDEVAAAVSYLAGSEASFVTGASLLVDGGYAA